MDGRMAELLPRDTKLKAGEAATRTLELIEKDGANFICGSLSASVQLAINNVAKERKTIFVSISQSDGINEAKHFSKYPKVNGVYSFFSHIRSSPSLIFILPV